jgi:hypothetical protein
VRVSERESGYSRLWWREAHTALRQAEQNGWRSHRAVWASTGDAYQVAHATPGDYGMLLCRFPPGEAAFQNLVSKPNLSALVSIDRSSGRFTGVTFLHRP